MHNNHEKSMHKHLKEISAFEQPYWEFFIEYQKYQK